MSEIEEQLLSTRLNNVYDKSAGHNDESAANEIVFDNPIDADAENIKLINSPCYILDNDICVSAWAILDDGPGVININHLWGTGKGLKIKNPDKIGSKIAGALAAAGYFNPDMLMYFSRKSDNIDGRQHQQMNANFSEMIKVIKTKDIDMTEADTRIKKGHNKLVRLPEPSKDKFDNDDVELIKKIFKHNKEICDYFDSEQTGLLQIFIYNEIKLDSKSAILSSEIIEPHAETNDDIINKKRIVNERYTRFNSELPKILDKCEFITYNTRNVFRGDKTFKYINVDDDSKNRDINSETCNQNFILGKKSISKEEDDDSEEEDDAEEEEEEEEEEEDAEEEEEDAEEEVDDWNYVESPHFGKFNKNVLTVKNSVWETSKGYLNICQLLNFNERFLITSDSVFAKTYIKKGEKITAPKGYRNITFLGDTYDHIAIVNKIEATEQATKMGLSKLEDLKQVYVYDGGRFLDKDKLPVFGIQERSMPNFRIVTCINSETQKLIHKRANKSSISLKDSEAIIKNTYNEIIKPILNIYSSTNKELDFEKSIEDWSVYKEKILIALGAIEKPVKPITAPINNSVLPSSNIAQVTPPEARVATGVSSISLQVAPPTPRSSTMVLSSLNKAQTISHLRRIKSKCDSMSGSKSRGDKSKLYTLLNNITKELVFDYDLMPEYIENLINIIEDSELNNIKAVKNAAELQNY
jgi:hypothetical protein